MELYQTIHYSVLLCLLFELSTNTKFKNIIIICWCIFFTIFGGLRWYTGTDWEQYLNHFLDCKWETIFTYQRANGHGMEPGFLFVNNLVKSIFGEFYVYNLIVVGFIQFTYYKFCHYFSPERPLLMYIVLMTLNPNYFPVRAGLSCGIAYWVWRFLQNDNMKGFILVVLCATLVHYQCIVLLPLFWLKKIPLKYVFAILLFGVLATIGVKFQDYFILLSLFVGGDIGDKAYGYTQGQSESYEMKSGLSLAGMILQFIFLNLFYYIRNKYKKIKIIDDEFFNVLIWGYGMYIGFFMVFSGGMGDLTRMASLFIPAFFILIVNVINTINKQSNQLVKKIAVFVFIAYLLFRVGDIWSGYWFELGCIPYKNIFDYNIL